MLEWLRHNHDAISALGTIVGALVFGFGVLQYRRAQVWKRTEFVASLYKELIQDDKCIRAMEMIDYPERACKIQDVSQYDGGDLNFIVDSLNFYNDNPNELHVKVRKDFDRFFALLEQFERAIRNRLVREKDVLPYLAYWMDALDDDNSSGTAIRKYMRDAEFDDVERLLRRRLSLVARLREMLRRLRILPAGRREDRNPGIAGGGNAGRLGFAVGEERQAEAVPDRDQRAG
jgi:hypothetical protein